MIVLVGDVVGEVVRPSGVVTFLFTDIEGSTRRWEADPEGMRAALAAHDEVLRTAIDSNGGWLFKHTGDGVCAAFASPGAAADAAIAAQGTLDLPVRMGIATGEAELRGDDYFGPALNRAARLMDAGHGGQVLVGATAASMVERSLMGDVELIDLGEHRLRDLGRPEHLFQLAHPSLRRSFASLRTLDAFPGNLPLQVSSFLGRDREMARCREALADTRILTLTGVGGVGKTRLALQVAALLVPEFRDGAWVVELAPVRDRAGVAEAVASTFGVNRTREDLEAVLVEAFASKQVLLVLDNCEHLLEGVADLVSQILHSCAGVKVLATSREGMAIDGEQLLAVPPLKVQASGGETDTSSDAVALFEERARAVEADFAVTPDNAAHVIDICRRLDGVPLAIELAAARVIALGPADLARRLDRRFEMLAGGRRGAVERHATLRAAIDWSYDLLSEPEGALLKRLSVFAGTFDLDAVEAICVGEPVDDLQVLDLLSKLVAQSLVVAEKQSLGSRYRLLETIRQYCEEQLDAEEVVALRNRHARYYTEFLEANLAQVWGPDGLGANQRRSAESENLLAAYTHAVDTANVDVASRLALFPVWGFLGGQFITPAAPVVALEGASNHRLFPVLLIVAAFQALNRGDHDGANQYYEQALAVHQAGVDAELDEIFEASSRAYVVNINIYAGRYEQASQAWENDTFASVGGVPAPGNVLQGGHILPGSRSGALASWVSVRQLGGLDRERSRVLAEEAVALARSAAAPLPIALSSIQLASLIAYESPDLANELLIESLETMAQPGVEMPVYLATAAVASLELGHWDLALAIGARVLWLIRWQPYESLAAGELACCARGVAVTQPDTAGLLVGAAYAAFRRGSPESRSATPRAPESSSTGANNPFIQALRDTHDIVATALGQDRAEALRDQGLGMELNDAISHVLTNINPPTILDAVNDLQMAASSTADTARDRTGTAAQDAVALTDRQLEVAQLVAQGFSNKDIAKRLDVSPYTVETHVRNILERLDATNRAQIVAWVKDNEHG